MATDEQDAQQFPQEILDWVAEHPEHVADWMRSVAFRRQLLAKPEDYGLSGPAGDWVRERLAQHGVDRLVGGQPGQIVAM